MFFKVGAMFGLDARIALAIFGALSVISGASLYSVIQEVEVKKHFLNAKELAKAYDHYYLDNAKSLPLHSSNVRLMMINLFENTESLPTWSGPYITGAFQQDSTTNVKYKVGGYIVTAYFYIKKSDGTDCERGNRDCNVTFMYPCATLEGVEACRSHLRPLDKYLDGSDGQNAGKFTWVERKPDAHYYTLDLGIPYRY